MSKRLATLLLITSMTACDKAPDQVADKGFVPGADPYAGGVVIVRVEGNPIYAEELDFTIERTFSQADQFAMNEDARKKVLDSLVASRLMRLSLQTQMDSDEQIDIERKVNAYREELYVKAYLQEHAVPEPVTTAMVEQYYQENPEQFGGGERKQFELLVTEQKPDEAKRDKLLADLESLRSNQDWSRSAATWRQRYGLVHQRSELASGLLDAQLEKQIESLKPGETSGVILIRGIPHIVRVTGYRKVPAKPLAEVSAEIRSTLASRQLRSAIKKVAEGLVKKSKIEYLEPSDGQ
ncbi:MAG: peptidyl-prolyl cis-trans isomerase [Pseudomonadota bacterium]